VKITKITAVYIAANLLKLAFSNCRKIYILGEIHTTMMSRSHIPPVSNKARGLWKQRQRKGKYFLLFFLFCFVFNSHSKLQIMLIRNKIFLWKRKTTAICQNSRHLTKIMVSVISVFPWLQSLIMLDVLLSHVIETCLFVVEDCVFYHLIQNHIYCTDRLSNSLLVAYSCDCMSVFLPVWDRKLVTRCWLGFFLHIFRCFRPV